MEKFKKLVQLGPVGMEPWAQEELKQYAEVIVTNDTVPVTDDEVVAMIGDADAVLLRPKPVLTKEILARVPNVKYIGMCCSLYSKESANVDIDFAQDHGMTVTGIRDYGDEGVVEYVIYQLVRILHGYDFPRWKERPLEITGLKVGFVGLGTSGGMTAEALQFLGADIGYFARGPKPEREEQGMRYMELRDLLSWADVVVTCLNKNTILLHEEEFEALGNGKIMFNTSIGPASDSEALKAWISNPDNIFCCDTEDALGDLYEDVKDLPNVVCVRHSAGMTDQSFDRLSQKVLDNIQGYFAGKDFRL